LPGDGELVATDLNQPMLDEARRRLPDDPRVRWQAADAQALPFDTGTFDAVACQFGLMFVPDKPLALREMRRVLRSGGMLLLSTWHDLALNAATAVVDELAFAELPANPPMFMRTPFSMPDPIALRALVEAAGFATVHVDTVAQTAEATSAADLAIGMVRGNPLSIQLAERGIDAAGFESRVAEALRRAFGDAPCRSSLSAHVVTAIA
jgi:ubiquinone/menaquinone biosynthesis C-methylase UbiE